ncbi:MAG: hypothetical protein U1E64_08695 [Sphingomonadaceae bacterium]
MFVTLRLLALSSLAGAARRLCWFPLLGALAGIGYTLLTGA